ncbi:MAG: nucleotide exchange factor GrpE [Bacillota bacterium]|nr:nucleotide exchange factor GrpE [Bacillota bacterium]
MLGSKNKAEKEMKKHADEAKEQKMTDTEKETSCKSKACDCESAEAKEKPEKSSTDDENQLEKQLAEEQDRYLRLNAEFQNYKKRVEKEKADLIKYGNEKLLTDLLLVLDNIDRAVKSSENTEDTRLRDGILLIKKAFDDSLAANGVAEIEAKDKEFNHDEHYAVMTEEIEGMQEGIVVDVLQKGYKLNGKVIRPSMVKVTK